MHTKDHVQHMVSDLYVGIAGHIAQELIDPLYCFLHGFGFLPRNFAEGHKNGEVDRATKIEKAAHNMMDPPLPFFIELFAVIFGI